MRLKNRFLTFFVAVMALNLVPGLAFGAGEDAINQILNQIRQADTPISIYARLDDLNNWAQTYCTEGGSNCPAALAPLIQRAADSLKGKAQELLRRIQNDSNNSHADLLRVLADHLNIQRGHENAFRNILEETKEAVRKRETTQQLEAVIAVETPKDLYSTLFELSRKAKKLCRGGNDNQGCAREEYRSYIEPVLTAFLEKAWHLHDSAQTSAAEKAKINQIINQFHGAAAHNETNVRGKLFNSLKAVLEAQTHELVDAARNVRGLDGLKDAIRNLYHHARMACNEENKKCKEADFNNLLKPIITELKARAEVTRREIRNPEEKSIAAGIITLLDSLRPANTFTELLRQMAPGRGHDGQQPQNGRRSRKQRHRDRQRQRNQAPAPGQAPAPEHRDQDEEYEFERVPERQISPEVLREQLARAQQIAAKLGRGERLTAEELQELEDLGRIRDQVERQEQNRDNGNGNGNGNQPKRKPKGALTAADLTRYFGGFKVSKPVLDKANNTVSVDLLFTIPSECARHFEFNAKNNPETSGCKDTVGFEILDRTGEGRECINKWWPEGQEKSCDLVDPVTHHEINCVSISNVRDLSNRAVGRLTFPNRDVLIQLFSKNTNLDSRDPHYMECKDFSSESPLFWETAKTAKERLAARKAAAQAEAIETAKLQVVHCREDEDQIAFARGQLEFLRRTSEELGGFGAKKGDEVAKSLDADEMKILTAKVDEAKTKDELKSLRDKLHAYGKAHSKSRDEVIAQLRKVAQKFALIKEYGESQRTLDKALNLKPSEADERVLDAYKKEIEDQEDNTASKKSLEELQKIARMGGNSMAIRVEAQNLVMSSRQKLMSRCSGFEPMELCLRAQAESAEQEQVINQIMQEAQMAEQQRYRMMMGFGGNQGMSPYGYSGMQPYGYPGAYPGYPGPGYPGMMPGMMPGMGMPGMFSPSGIMPGGMMMPRWY